jgi:hypothetical protein
VFLERDIIALRYVVDGNFTAQHMNMKNPEADIALADGLGYMVQDGPYQNHVATAPDNKEVSAFDIIENIL